MSPLSKDKSSLRENLLDSTEVDEPVVTKKAAGPTAAKSRFSFSLFSKKEAPTPDALEEAQQYKKRKELTEPLLNPKDAGEDEGHKPRGPH